MAVSVAPGTWVAVGCKVGVAGTSVPVGVAVAPGTPSVLTNATTGVAAGGTVSVGGGLALWAAATVRAVTRNIKPATARPTTTYTPQRRVLDENAWPAGLL